MSEPNNDFDYVWNGECTASECLAMASEDMAKGHIRKAVSFLTQASRETQIQRDEFNEYIEVLNDMLEEMDKRINRDTWHMLIDERKAGL